MSVKFKNEFGENGISVSIFAIYNYLELFFGDVVYWRVFHFQRDSLRFDKWKSGNMSYGNDVICQSKLVCK